MNYNWQQEEWPHFEYELSHLEDAILELTSRMGRASGLIDGLSDEIKNETLIDMMVAEAVKTSEIEGEYLSRKDVMSSIRNNLGLNSIQEQVNDWRADGVGLLMIKVREEYDFELSKEMLFSWHELLMSGNPMVKAGAWRDHKEPMQVISGAVGKEKIHFEALPSAQVPSEMGRFIQWFNETSPEGTNRISNPAVRAAVAHLYFESIHPFEDGNGRIGRAISEKALSQGIGRPALLSLSRSIEANRNAYYDALKQGQSSNDITEWITYFVNTVLYAQVQAEAQIEFTLKKTRFYDRNQDQLNERQLKVIRRTLEEGAEGFEGGMNANKYMKIAKTSKATATRDLQDLVKKALFVPLGLGRSTRYEVNLR